MQNNPSDLDRLAIRNAALESLPVCLVSMARIVVEQDADPGDRARAVETFVDCALRLKESQAGEPAAGSWVEQLATDFVKLDPE